MEIRKHYLCIDLEGSPHHYPRHTSTVWGTPQTQNQRPETMANTRTTVGSTRRGAANAAAPAATNAGNNAGITVLGTAREFFKSHGMIPDSHIRASKAGKERGEEVPVVRFTLAKDIQLPGEVKPSLRLAENGEPAMHAIVLSKNAAKNIVDSINAELDPDRQIDSAIGVELTKEDFLNWKVGLRDNQGLILITESGETYTANASLLD